MGGACWEDVIATFPDSNPWLDSLTMSSVERNGSIGGDLLTRFKIVFNFPLEVMYVRKGRSFKKDFTYNLSGIVVKAIGSELNIYEIVEVRENSVADEAGLLPGDRIMKINNRSTEDISLDYVVAQLNSKPKKKIRLRVARDQVVLDKVIVLRQEI